MRYVCLVALTSAVLFAQSPKRVAANTPAAASFEVAPPTTTKISPRDGVLTPAAQEAVNLSVHWTGGDNHPAVGPDGRVMYSFGAGLPVVVCAPLRVCVIELQPGEKIAGEPHLGDSVRWNITPAVYGSGSGETNVIVLKPQESGLDTDLLIPTDRRAYYIRLVSKPTEYIARTAFKYPEDDNADKWKKRVDDQRAKDREVEHRQVMMPAVVTAEALNFSYIASGAASIRPVRIYDDGAKTYLRMPVTMRSREAPILLVIGADGTEEVTNYRVTDLTYVIDRLFDRAELRLGKGKKAEKVEIRRDPKERT